MCAKKEVETGDGAHARGCGVRCVDVSREGVGRGEDGWKGIFRSNVVDLKGGVGYAGKGMQRCRAPEGETLIRCVEEIRQESLNGLEMLFSRVRVELRNRCHGQGQVGSNDNEGVNEFADGLPVFETVLFLKRF